VQYQQCGTTECSVILTACVVFITLHIIERQGLAFCLRRHCELVILALKLFFWSSATLIYRKLSVLAKSKTYVCVNK
jgi:hypothetical protein